MIFSDSVVQFYPNRITVVQPKVNDMVKALERRAGLSKSLANLAVKKSSVNLSASSKKNIRDSIFAMYQLSKPRTIQTAKGKFIYNFRQSFITLTLPSKQVHSDVVLKQALNHFLTNIRRSFNIENYVWKAELQENENIHFHISTDKHIPWQAIRYYWLLAIKPLGYVDAYRKKFSRMSFSEYENLRWVIHKSAGSKFELTKQQIINAYADGCRSNWSSPNCTDVSSVTTASSVSNYLSKYFAKDSTEKDEKTGKSIITIRQLIRFRKFGKVWARSQSLSRLKFKNKFEFQDIKNFLADLVKFKFAKKINYDFATVFYLNFRNMKGIHLDFFVKILFCNAQRYAYPFPT